jgi:putative membrane-bound dehydrogenase-like protein
VHAFVVGPDGRWYFNFGNTGRTIHDKHGKPVVDRLGNVVNDSGRPYRQGMVFRCKPDGTDFEVLGHNFRNNYEVAVDSFGSLWQSDNDDDGNQGVRINFVMEHGNYGYVDERSGAGWQAGRTNIEPEIPLRHWHQNDPGVVPNLLLTGGGSPTGICVYEGSLLPKRFHAAMIHCDAGPNVVRAYPVTPRRGRSGPCPGMTSRRWPAAWRRSRAPTFARGRRRSSGSPGSSTPTPRPIRPSPGGSPRPRTAWRARPPSSIWPAGFGSRTGRQRS